MKPHKHSNVARAIVNRMIIAKLNSPAETFEARVVSTQDLNKNTKVFTLRIENEEGVNYRVPSSTNFE